MLVRTGGRLFTVGAAQLLVDLGVGMVGSDAPSLDDDPYPVHTLLLGQGILLLENLRGLDEIVPGPLTCACLPLPLVGERRGSRAGGRLAVSGAAAPNRGRGSTARRGDWRRLGRARLRSWWSPLPAARRPPA